MLKLKHLTLKNFFSVGQVTQTVSFDEGYMTLILGDNPDYGAGIRNGVGKAQPMYSKIRTPTGWKTMKEIGVGDFVCTPTGGTTVVLGKYPQGKKKIYEITTLDGKKTRACREHLWSVVVDGVEQVIDTAEISKLMNSNVRVNLPLVHEVADRDIEHIMPPYAMGLFLSCGRIDSGQIVFKDVDPAIMDKLKVYLTPDNYTLNYEDSNIWCTYKHQGLSNPLVKYILDMELDKLKGRCIPEAYKISSYYQRRDFLMGFFDSGAEQDEEFVVNYFHYKQPELANDIQEMAWSVGGVSELKMVTYSIRDKLNGVQKSDKDIILKTRFKNANKFFSIESKRDFPLLNDLLCPIKSIKFVEESEACCIKVNDASHLYVTDDYIPTHNTTVINGISYAFYGQPITTSKQDEMVNNVNDKNMMVTLDFNADGIDYRIERGRKPKVMRFIRYDGDKEVEIGDDEQDRAQGANAATQTDINNVIHISYLLFKYIVAMNTYSTHFMAAGASEQRTVIEEILGVDVMSRKAEVLAQRIKDTKVDIDKEAIRIEAVQDANRRVEDNINNLKHRSNVWEQDKVKTIDSLIETLTKLGDVDIDAEIATHEKNAETRKLINEVKLVESELASLKRFKNKTVTDLQKIDRDLQSFNKNICPSCDQEIKNDNHESHKQKLTEDMKTMITEVDDHEKKIASYEEVLNEIGDLPDIEPTFYNSINDAYEHKSTMQNLLDKIDSKKQEENPYTYQINELENGDTGVQEIDYDNMKHLERKLAHEKFLQKLLTNRDSFVRKRIIDYSLPFLNKVFQDYIDKMSLPHKVLFDPNLTFSISDKGRNISFNNLSRGEQNRVTFCLNLAFRDLYENLVAPINCLFVDEILDFGMDTVGAKDGVALLKEVAMERKKAVYLVTHKDELMEHVDKTILVRKENGFTTYEHIDS